MILTQLSEAEELLGVLRHAAAIKGGVELMVVRFRRALSFCLSLCLSLAHAFGLFFIFGCVHNMKYPRPNMLWSNPSSLQLTPIGHVDCTLMQRECGKRIENAWRHSCSLRVLSNAGNQRKRERTGQRAGDRW